MGKQNGLEWVTEVLGVKSRTLTMEDTRLSVSEWDSLGILMLLSRLEEDHGIFVSADEIAKIESVQEICELLERKAVFSN